MLLEVADEIDETRLERVQYGYNQTLRGQNTWWSTKRNMHLSMSSRVYLAGIVAINGTY